MKKLAVLAFAAVLVFAFTVPAMALDNIFGGYWRTRAYTQQDFSGSGNTGVQDLTQVDTRTRLFYTAKFSDNFQFVNAFEMNAVWGEQDGDGSAVNPNSSYGDIGADGVRVEVKNSYADFTLGNVNLKIGVQGLVISRGFVFDDDAAGVVFTYAGDGFAIPVGWIKAYEGSMGKDYNDYDVDYYFINPSFKLGIADVKPLFFYAKSDDARRWDATNWTLGEYSDLDLWLLGADIDMNIANNTSLWFTGIYEGGSADLVAGGDTDFDAYLLAVGATVDLGSGMNVHGQVFSATGDETGTNDTEAFGIPQGQSYYWAEIMGFGIFDNQASANSCADQISGIVAANIGMGFTPIPDLTIDVDLWYAKLAEDDSNGEDELGTEIDIKASYKIMSNLNLDVVAAYLFTGDATYKGSDQEDAMEIGTQLSLSF